MRDAAPSVARILTMVVFALSCFGLLLFLWLSFGGPIPIKPKGYRVQVAFPEATTLGTEADVRVAGVSVGKVRTKDLDGGKEGGANRTAVDIELDRKYAPLRTDARAIIRQKSLLGETYVELTPGSSEKTVPENGRLPDGQVQSAVELDEIFQALDPTTRAAFRSWQQDLSEGIAGRGLDLNDALGTLPGFAKDGGDLLAVLDSQEGALQRLVKNTGVTFGALNSNEARLRNLVTSAGEVFEATASEQEALAETIRIFPTFLDESKLTVERLQTFSTDTRPLIQDLRPVARDLQPTLRDVRALSPDLQRFFRDLGPLADASKVGLPAASEILRGLKPTLAELTPFLNQLNPILQYLELHQFDVTDFLSNGGAALADTTPSPGGGIGHYLRQFGPTGSESVAMARKRIEINRGNSYLPPLALADKKGADFKIFPNFDCKPSGGERPPQGNSPGCFLAGKLQFGGRLQGRFPRVEAADYGKGQ